MPKPQGQGMKWKCKALKVTMVDVKHSYDILGARMLRKPKETRILTNFIDQPV